MLGPREWKTRACTRAQQLVGKENNYMSGIKEPHRQGGQHFHHAQCLSSQFWHSCLLPHSRIQMPHDSSGSYPTRRAGFIQSITNTICDLLWNWHGISSDVETWDRPISLPQKVPQPHKFGKCCITIITLLGLTGETSYQRRGEALGLIKTEKKFLKQTVCQMYLTTEFLFL